MLNQRSAVMSVEQISYSDARKLMKPGDVIAFGGKGHFSEIIKFATFSDVSHVGVILQTKILDDDTGRFFLFEDQGQNPPEPH